MIREFTRKLMAAVEEGMLDPVEVLRAALNHMSEAEVRDMCEANELLPDDGEDVEDGED